VSRISKEQLGSLAMAKERSTICRSFGMSSAPCCDRSGHCT
jgi:hypothetical protein